MNFQKTNFALIVNYIPSSDIMFVFTPFDLDLNEKTKLEIHSSFIAMEKNYKCNLSQWILQCIENMDGFNHWR